MKNLYTLFTALLITASAMAQVPEKMSYQAVVRDAGNALVTSQGVGMQISILQGSASGTAVYEETQTPNTNINGLVSIEIGSGTVVSGTFNTIDWSNGPYFIKTETDPTGGTSYTITGTSQLMSVPYALHAKTADNVSNDAVDDADADPANELQDISLTASDLTLSNGSTIDLSVIDTDTQLDETAVDAYVANNGYLTTEVDGSTTNEIQDISLTGTDLTITSGSTLDLSGIDTDTQLDETAVDAYVANNGYLTTEVDGSTTNEIQDISLTGTDLTITNGSTLDLSGIDTDTQLNETAVDSYVANNGYLTTEVDGSTTNEIQTIERAGTTVTLSNGGGSYEDSVNTYTAGDGIDVTGMVISETKYQIGDFAQGGIVIWVDETGEHGIVCAKSDQSSGVRWNAGTHGDTQAKGDGPFAGEMNTAIIIAAQVAIGDDGNTYAARICNESCITEGGVTYCDWYLPSKGESNKMYTNKATINATAIANGGSSFASDYYWNSTEKDTAGAYKQSFINGFNNAGAKGSSYYVRAVRAF
ncbi:MAG: DUF1566 domain-containing protein [Crocinitomicaceae bacterium]|nr:DUF1566 domain-containing protein [Crocinitomicaceae bacterium]